MPRYSGKPADLDLYTDSLPVELGFQIAGCKIGFEIRGTGQLGVSTAKSQKPGQTSVRTFKVQTVGLEIRFCLHSHEMRQHVGKENGANLLATGQSAQIPWSQAKVGLLLGGIRDDQFSGVNAAKCVTSQMNQLALFWA